MEKINRDAECEFREAQARAGADKQVGMVGQPGPGVHGPGALPGQGREPGPTVRSLALLAEERGPLNPADHHVMERLGGVEASLARHGGSLS